MLAIGLQTDVLGIHWIAFTVWLAAGLALGLPRAEERIEAFEETAPVPS